MEGHGKKGIQVRVPQAMVFHAEFQVGLGFDYIRLVLNQTQFPVRQQVIDQRLGLIVTDDEQLVAMLFDKEGRFSALGQEKVGIAQVNPDGAGRRIRYLLVNQAGEVIDVFLPH